MHPDGSIDEHAFANLIERQIAQGSSAVVINGTTAEASTLDAKERGRQLSLAKEIIGTRIPIMAGTGTNVTASTINFTKQAKECGVDACLVVTPYYNRPTQQGLLAHFRAVAANVDIPIYLYNVPARTGCDLLPNTIVELARVSNILGVKEATGDIDRIKFIRAATANRFILLSGDDQSAHKFMQAGGDGVISVTANLVPKQMQQLMQALRQQEFELVDNLVKDLAELHQAMGVETNPAPVKYALHQMRLIENNLRLPLVQLEPIYHQYIINIMLKHGLLASAKALHREKS